MSNFMWKDAFSHTKNERRAAILLAIFLLITLFCRFCMTNEIKITPTDEKERLALEKQIRELEDSRNSSFSRKTMASKRASEKPLSLPSERFLFDPNKIDSISFTRLGIPPHIVRIISNYRRKGGVFRKPTDFLKVPYLDKKLCSELLPYITIAEQPKVKRDSIVNHSIAYVKQPKLAVGEIVELSSADTTNLKKIPGIGSGIAHAIVAYRDRLGGFVSMDQLAEIRSITLEQLQNIKKYLVLKQIAVMPIDINRAGLERLRAHPYLNFYQARAILELRKKKGKLTSLEEFSLYEEFTQNDFNRLKPYLQFSR